MPALIRTATFVLSASRSHPTVQSSSVQHTEDISCKSEPLRCSPPRIVSPDDGRQLLSSVAPKRPSSPSNPEADVAARPIQQPDFLSPVTPEAQRRAARPMTPDRRRGQPARPDWPIYTVYTFYTAFIHHLCIFYM